MREGRETGHEIEGQTLAFRPGRRRQIGFVAQARHDEPAQEEKNDEQERSQHAGPDPVLRGLGEREKAAEENNRKKKIENPKN